MLRRGGVVATLDAEKTATEEIARLMVGADADQAAQKSAGCGAGEVRRPISITEKQPPVLDVRGLCVAPSPSEPRIENISFTVGRGKSRNCRDCRKRPALARGRPCRTGEGGSGAIIFDGSDITALAVADRLRIGVCRVPENPSEEALLPDGRFGKISSSAASARVNSRGAGLSSSARPLLLRSIRSPKTALRRGGRMSPFPAYREETCRRRRLRERFAAGRALQSSNSPREASTCTRPRGCARAFLP